MKNPSPKKSKGLEREVVELVEQLKKKFQTKVEIKTGGRCGKIEISYSGLEELSRIIELLGI